MMNYILLKGSWMGFDNDFWVILFWICCGLAIPASLTLLVFSIIAIVKYFKESTRGEMTTARRWGLWSMFSVGIPALLDCFSGIFYSVSNNIGKFLFGIIGSLGFFSYIASLASTIYTRRKYPEERAGYIAKWIHIGWLIFCFVFCLSLVGCISSCDPPV